MSGSLTNLLSSMFGVNMNMNGIPRGGPLGMNKFTQKYHAYSPAYWDSENRTKLEQGDKIVIPASALEQLSRLNIQFPIMFKITHVSDILPRESHCSVLEFTSKEGEVYLPLWMIDNLGLNPDGQSLVKLDTVRLEKGIFVQFQAHETKFAMLNNPKAVLEKALRSYSCLTVGDTIQVSFADYIYKLDVTKLKTARDDKAKAVSIIETDIKVDFLEPRDYKDYEKKQKQHKKRNQKFVKKDNTEFEEEFDDDDWSNDPKKQSKQEKVTYFNNLKVEGSKGIKLKRSTSNPKSNNNNNNSNNNNNNNSYDKSTILPSKTRGIPLGGNVTNFKMNTTMHGLNRQISSPNKSHKRKEEEVVGNMRYIYEIDEFGNRKCVRRLPVRKNDTFKGNGYSLKG